MTTRQSFKSPNSAIAIAWPGLLVTCDHKGHGGSTQALSRRDAMDLAKVPGAWCAECAEENVAEHRVFYVKTERGRSVHCACGLTEDHTTTDKPSYKFVPTKKAGKR